MRGIYRVWYSQHPESSLADWLSDMRRAHGALFDMDAGVDRMLGQSIAILEYTILSRGGQLPLQITSSTDDQP
ncbi:hypothetical protein SBC2_06170 [Caballeronia sp. SBC2]|nr:hypothetical protein SBC2_06170 [Caballeronia sp. SBC2]